MIKFMDEEYNEAYEKSKSEKFQDYRLLGNTTGTKYTGIILRTYKPSIAALLSKRGLKMEPFIRN